MTQDELNRQAWNNPANWRGPKLLSIYSSSEDSRLWVRKRIPALGWPINMAHPGAVVVLVAVVGVLLIAAPAVAIAVLRWDVLIFHIYSAGLLAIALARRRYALLGLVLAVHCATD